MKDFLEAEEAFSLILIAHINHRLDFDFLMG